MMKYTKIRRNIKAISPVISVLLMIAIAVVASLVTYAWVMGYMNFTTNKVGKAIQIQSVNQAGTIYVQNVGTSPVELSLATVYLNGGIIAVTPPSTPLAAGDTATFTGLGSLVNGDVIKVVSNDGTFSQVTYRP